MPEVGYVLWVLIDGIAPAVGPRKNSFAGGWGGGSNTPARAHFNRASVTEVGGFVSKAATSSWFF